MYVAMIIAIISDATISSTFPFFSLIEYYCCALVFFF